MTRSGQETEATAADARAILSFALLLCVLAAGFALALGHAEISPAVVQTLANILN